MNTSNHISYLRITLPLLFVLFSILSVAQQSTVTVNDISQLNPIRVDRVITPTTTQEIVQAVKQSAIVSIGGSRHSMGGQIATEHSVHLDMRQFNKVVAFSAAQKRITVQAGITWRQVLEYIDKHDLSVSIMQSYADFTVGGSLSVNVHGRYIGQGPMILSVLGIQVVLASGEVVTASPNNNADLFYGVIGGYGGLGVITECTLQLTNNSKVERQDIVMPIKNYHQWFMKHIRNDTSVVFHNANMYPPKYDKVRAISFVQTNKAPTVKTRLRPLDKSYAANRFGFKLAKGKAGKWLREHVIDPVQYKKNPVYWRNYEASHNARELEPKSRLESTYVLQEYFVPVDSFNSFYPQLAAILQKHDVNMINVSIRHAKKDPGSVLAWAKTEVYAFVLYYTQGTTEKDKAQVGDWTRKLINAAIRCRGSYYLPYQLHATEAQFESAYPKAQSFFLLKKRLDPTNKFRNKMWDKYYKDGST
jgi:FAD/FMN-containing dehydrogenase